MKTILIYLVLTFALLSGGVAVQHSYLLGQESPFNGKFNEPHLIGVDSILYIRYSSVDFDDFIHLNDASIESIDLFLPTTVRYTVLATDDFGGTDSFKSVVKLSNYESPFVEIRDKKYDNNGRLIYSFASMKYPYIESVYDYKYTYDDDGRIKQIVYTTYEDKDMHVISYDTTKYDYALKPLWSSETILVNTIYNDNDSAFVYYTDSGYDVIYNAYSDDFYETTTYIFDDKVCLSEAVHTYHTPTATSAPTSVMVSIPAETSSYKTEYKYTNAGYEMYVFGVLREEYRLQEDGYLVELIRHITSEHSSNPDENTIENRERYSYFKDFYIIVNNESDSRNAQTAYGIGGAVVIKSDNVLPVSVYTI
jgi:hypothetical protein